MIHRRVGGAGAWFTDRTGGTSDAPYHSLNLADHVGDAPDAVAANRAIVAAAIGHPDRVWVQPHHVHGTTVRALTRRAETVEEADGAATGRDDLLLVAIGADCAPIAIANETACAAIHAGWRGAVDGVIDAGVAAVRALGSGPVHVVVGPCVCVAHYEFGAPDLEPIVARLGPEVAGTSAVGTPALDLRAVIAAACRRADADDVEFLDICTVESSDHFSYRRDGLTGRHGVVVTRA